MVYEIKEGDHYPNNLFRLPWFRLNTVKGNFTFLTAKGKTTVDTNKLVGLSDNLHHHKDSIRLGWRWKGDKIEILVIVYVKGKREIKPWKLIDPFTKHEFFIKILREKYYVELDGEIKTFTRKSGYFLPSLVLKPYYGGKEKANEKTRIEINYK